MDFKEARDKIKQSDLLTLISFKEKLHKDYEFYLEWIIAKWINKSKIKEKNQLYFIFAQFKDKELDFLKEIKSTIITKIEKVSSLQFETFLSDIKNKLTLEISQNFNIFLKYNFKKSIIELKESPSDILEEIKNVNLNDSNETEILYENLDVLTLFSKKELKDIKEKTLKNIPPTYFIKKAINFKTKKKNL